MTPVETLKALSRAMSKLQPNERLALKRTYERTWAMVTMYIDGLMTPTKAGGVRLADLLEAVRKEGLRSGIAQGNEPTAEERKMGIR